MQNQIVSGAVGAAVLSGLHEAGRRLVPHAPRMDVVGERGLRRLLGRSRAPRGKKLYWATLASDVIANGAFYAMALFGSPQHPVMRAATLGGLMGVGAVALPKPLGLGRPPHSRHAENRAMTVGYYALGGVAAAVVYAWLARRR